jgi:hypothetical protein
MAAGEIVVEAKRRIGRRFGQGVSSKALVACASPSTTAGEGVIVALACGGADLVHFGGDHLHQT